MELKVMKVPVVDLSECVKCDICVDMCPQVFVMNDAGFIEVLPCEDYEEDDINEVIKNCRGDCISWDEET